MRSPTIRQRQRGGGVTEGREAPLPKAAAPSESGFSLPSGAD